MVAAGLQRMARDSCGHSSGSVASRAGPEGVQAELRTAEIDELQRRGEQKILGEVPS
jgi:hypothetical protein